MQKVKFRFTGRHVDSFNAPGVLNLMFLDLTNQCPLRCLYCFNHRILDQPPSHLRLEALEKILRSKVARNVRNWFLSGGEPLCYPYLDEALALFRDFGHRPKIATNGILLRPEVADKWVSLGVQSVQFSMDTLDPVVFATLNRGTGESHRAILENLRYAVRSPLRVVVSSVLTRANMSELPDIMRFCLDAGVDSYTLYLNIPAARVHTDIVVPRAQALGVVDGLIRDYARLCATRIIDLSIPCIQFSEPFADWSEMTSLRLHACGAGQYNLKVGPDGRVSACICQDNPEFIVGDLRDQDLDEIWASERIERFRGLYKSVPECRECPVREKCRGGCRNEAYVFGRDGILSPDPHCEFFGPQRRLEG